MDNHSLSSIQNIENKVLRCVTIRQILRPITPGLRSVSFGMFMLVANVYRESIDSQGCRWFGFDDGFGKIDGYKRQAEGDFTFGSFAYARIIGESEHRGNRKLLKIFHIEPVYEAHEIFHHLLQTIIDALIPERGPPPIDHHVPSCSSSSTLLKPSQERMNHVLSASREVSFSNDAGVRTSKNQACVSDSEDELLAAPCLALPMLQADIIASISALQVESGGDMETGVHVIPVVQEMHLSHPNITVLELFAAMEQLLKEGVIYNTIDDQHYACRGPERRLSSEHFWS